MTREARRGHRDLIATAADDHDALVYSDRRETVTEVAFREQIPGAKARFGHVGETWRSFEEINVTAQLAPDALFVRLHGELDSGVVAPAA